MLYKILDKYYVKVGHYFIEVDFIYGDDEIAIKPTERKIEITNDLQYNEISFLELQRQLLENRKNTDKKSKKSSK